MGQSKAEILHANQTSLSKYWITQFLKIQDDNRRSFRRKVQSEERVPILTKFGVRVNDVLFDTLTDVYNYFRWKSATASWNH